MSLIYRCDRCNKELTVEMPPRNLRFDVHVYGRTDGGDSSISYDLCEECKEAFFTEYMRQNKKSNV